MLGVWAGRNKGMTTALASIVTLLVAVTVASTVFAMYFRQREDLAEYAQYVSNIQAVNPQSGDKRSTILARRALNVRTTEASELGMGAFVQFGMATSSASET